MRLARRSGVVKEKAAEEIVRHWFEKQRFEVRKGDNVDVEVFLGRKLKHVIEVKGDQFLQTGPRKGEINHGALRNTFFMGLGQMLIARSRHKTTLTFFALTRMYEAIADKYADVLRDHKIAILWVSKNGVSASSDGQQGHPEGVFSSGAARFCVRQGSLQWVKVGGKLEAGVASFAGLCRLLEIPVGGDSAARVLSRHSRKTGS